MPSIQVYHYDAFTTKPGKGNPAGIVLNGDELTEIQMQEIAYQVGFNETAFLVESEIADWGIRFFTPGHEMNLCGHATIATIYAVKTQKLLVEKSTLTIETKAGVLPLTIDSTSDKETDIIMNQASPTFQAFRGSKQDLAKSIGLQETELDDQLPIVYGSTGTWTLLVPIKELAVFQKMKPNNQDFPSILQEIPASSVHPFCTETYNPQADMHARHFSSPYSGTIEDAVTGTASGAMGAYFATYMDKGFDESLNLMVEQGHEISKEGMVGVKVSKRANTLDVKITGNAVYVNDMEVII